MDDCVILFENLFGEEGYGFKYVMVGFDGGWLNIGVCLIGVV